MGAGKAVLWAVLPAEALLRVLKVCIKREWQGRDTACEALLVEEKEKRSLWFVMCRKYDIVVMKKDMVSEYREQAGIGVA